MAAKSVDTPTFNLKAVVQETGLKPDTLRAWERRYGLPTPGRTIGKHRLYSQRDIDILKWLNARQEQGLSISRAVDLWRRLEGAGQDPLADQSTAEPLPAPPPILGQALGDLQNAWVRACLDFDEAQAERVLSQSFAVYSPETVCLEVLRRGLVHIGNGWHAGEITAQQEHFTSELALRRLETLIGATQPTRPGRILLGCPPEESHTFSPLLLSFLLRRQGWHTLFLGANVPNNRFETTLTQVRPHLVILAAQLLSTAATLADMAEIVRRHQIPLAFGGLIFTLTPGLADRIPGHYLGDHLELAPPQIERLLASPPAFSPSPPALPPGYTEARDSFLVHYPRIGARVSELLQLLGHDLSPLYLFIANTHLAQNILAALRLGALEFLGADMAWIKSLLHERNIPLATLQTYLRAYHQAAAELLDARGAPILAWLDRITQNTF